MKLELHMIELPLAHFTLRINTTLEGQMLGIVGPSGAGKTSLLDLIAGLRQPVSARIVLDGTVLTDRAAGHFFPPQKRGLGYVPQEGLLFPHLSVERNIRYGMWGKPEDGLLTLEHVVDVLEISQLLSRNIQDLSGGEKQRVAIARALLSQPRLLLLDEPLRGLDDALREKSLLLLARVRDEFRIPCLYVSHRRDEIQSLCEAVFTLEKGSLISSEMLGH